MKACDSFKEELIKASTPSKNRLFDVDINIPFVDEPTRKYFHQIAKLLLCVACRGRKDMLPTITFLTQSVLCFREENYHKLRRMLNYIHGTIDLVPIVGIEDLCRMYTWIDAAHELYPNMRGHTGRAFTFDTGIFCAMLSKQTTEHWKLH